VGAYLTEVLRAGISSVGKGQLEAAQILGLEHANRAA
jgi:polar amino acid transport system permease protein